MRKFTLFLMSLFLSVGAMAQTPVLELTQAQISSYPYELSDADATTVFNLDALTVAVKVTNPGVSGRRGLFVTSDPTKAKNTDAEGIRSRYVAYGLNADNMSYLASWRSGDRFSGNAKFTASSELVCVYVISSSKCELYLNGAPDRSWSGNGFDASYEFATPKMVKAAHPNAKIYIGGGMSTEGAGEVFNGTITGVKVYSGALTATEIAAISFEDPALLAQAREEFDAAYAAAGAILDEAELVVTRKEVELQVTDPNEANYLWCNYPESSEGNISYLINGNSNVSSEFFHSQWSKPVPAAPHYLEVDFGTPRNEFSFGYTTRNFDGGNDFPDAIEVLGSNDEDANFVRVYNVTSGLPQAGNRSWGPAEVSSENAYRYYRFNITAERIYWHMSEFDIYTNEISVAAKYAEVASEVAALKNIYDAHAGNAGYTTAARLNEAAEALNAAVEAVNAGTVVPVFSYETLEKPTFTRPGNTTTVAAIELNGTNIPGFTYTQGTTTRFDMPQVEAGKTYNLDLTYYMAYGDLAIFQIDKNNRTQKYGYYVAQWPGNQITLMENNAALICQQLGLDSFNELKVDYGENYLKFPYKITIDENLEPGDITVVRVMVGEEANGAFGLNTQGGCLDLVFEVKAPSHTLNVSDAGWATLMLGYNTVIPSTVKAYTVSEINNGYVTLTQVQGILPAQAPVLIEAAAGEHYFEMTNEAGSDLGNNWLEGTLADAVIQKAEGWSYYVLGVVDDEVGFYNAKLGDDDTQFKNGANKAYLLVQGKSPIASYSFRFEEGTTGISEVKGENGEVKVIYDLTGRKVEAISAPGIYIVGGKKVLVK